MLIVARKHRQKRGSKKPRQQAHNKATGKYRKAFLRTVARTGKWRGRKIPIERAY